MNCNKSLMYLLVFIILSISVPFSQGAVKFYQSSKINKDGSISITFTYSANESDIKQGTIGNLPFIAQTVKEYFSFPSGEIKKVSFYKDQKDPNVSNVSVDVVASDLSKISNAKALNGIKIGWLKRDTGVVFTWNISTSFMQSNFVDTYQFILTAEGDIKSTNGVFKDNICRWFIYKDNPAGAYIFATLNPNQNLTASNVTSEESNSPNTDEKSCGLFGMELPILLLGGLVISQRIRKNKS